MTTLTEVEVSPRQALAEKLASFVQTNRLARSSEITRKGIDGRVWYEIALDEPSMGLEGMIRVYSGKYLLIKYTSRYFTTLSTASRVFRKETDLLEFLDAAFVRYDEESATKALEKST